MCQPKLRPLLNGRSRLPDPAESACYTEPMPYKKFAGLRAFQFKSLASHSVLHGVFTRQGGVSEEPWASLNVGGGIGDEPANVAENRRRVLSALGRPHASTYDVWQIHSAQILHADEPRLGPPFPKADGLITANPQVTLMLRFADCVPVMLLDPITPAIGLVHAGWKGTILGTVKEGVRGLMHQFGSDPSDILAAIGPAIAAHHYPVGPEVVDAFRRTFGEGASDFLIPENGDIHFDLSGANAELLRREGVSQIELSSICTACHLDEWYSHRGEVGRTGRFAAVLALADE